jgi:hypothetical protein
MSTDQSNLLSSDSIILNINREEDSDINPNSLIPPHTCEVLKCICWPCLISLDVLPVACCCCCRTKTHPTWDRPFEIAVTALRSGATNIGRCWCALRCITDPPLGVVPKWTPNLPKGIGIVENTIAPHNGEWFYKQTSSRSPCCSCCKEYPGNPQLTSLPWNTFQDDETKQQKYILYFHGGAFALCTSKTHRALCSQLCNMTDTIILCPNYSRPPEHQWPLPVQDCLDCYKWMLNVAKIKSENIIFAGDSAGGKFSRNPLKPTPNDKLDICLTGSLVCFMILLFRILHYLFFLYLFFFVLYMLRVLSRFALSQVD